MSITKLSAYTITLRLFCYTTVPKVLLQKYLQDSDSVLELQDWIYSHRKQQWYSAIAILEAVECIINGALENDNLEFVAETKEKPRRNKKAKAKEDFLQSWDMVIRQIPLR